MRVDFDQGVSVALLACAAAVMWKLYATEAPPPPPPPTPPSVLVAGADSIALTGQVLHAAPEQIISILVFSDYQCPACRSHDADLSALIEKVGDVVSIRIRHFPIARIHPQATQAATAALCARGQQEFGRLHRVLFDSSAALSRSRPVDWFRWAQVRAFDEASVCAESESMEAEVEASVEFSRSIGVRGTPATLIGDHLYLGSMGLDRLLHIVDSLRTERRAR